jgi:hypothetical protein
VSCWVVSVFGIPEIRTRMGGSNEQGNNRCQSSLWRESTKILGREVPLAAPTLACFGITTDVDVVAAVAGNSACGC